MPDAPTNQDNQPEVVEANEAVKQLAEDLNLAVDQLVAKSGKSITQLNAMDADQLAALKTALTPVEANDAVKQLAADLGLTIDELVTKSEMSIEQLNAMDADQLAALKTALTPVEANDAVKQLAADLGLTIDELVAKSEKTIEQLNAMSNEELAAVKASLAVGTITSVTIKFGETVADENVILLTDSNVTASWTIEGNVESCSYQVADSDGTVIASQTAVEQNSLDISFLQITAGDTYTLMVNVIPKNGTDEDAF